MASKATECEIGLFFWWRRNGAFVSEKQIDQFSERLGETSLERIEEIVPPTLRAMRLEGGEELTFGPVSFLRPNFPFQCDVENLQISTGPLLKNPQLLLRGEGAALPLSDHPADLMALYQACLKAQQLRALYFDVVTHPRSYLSPNFDIFDHTTLFFPPLELSECGCDRSDSSRFNRFFSKRRDQMEQRVVDHVIKTVLDRSSEVRLLEMGCGNLFPMWRILGLLMLQGYHRFHVGLIDPQRPRGYDEGTDLIEKLIQFFRHIEDVDMRFSYSPLCQHFFQCHPDFRPHAMMAIDFDQFHTCYKLDDLPELAQRFLQKNSPSLYQRLKRHRNWQLRDLNLACSSLDEKGAFILGFGKHDFIFERAGDFQILHSANYARAILKVISGCFPKGSASSIRMAVFNDLLPVALYIIASFAKSGVQQLELSLPSDTKQAIPGSDFLVFLSNSFPAITFSLSQEDQKAEELERGCYSPTQKYDLVVLDALVIRDDQALKKICRERGKCSTHQVGNALCIFGFNKRQLTCFSVPYAYPG